MFKNIIISVSCLLSTISSVTHYISSPAGRRELKLAAAEAQDLRRHNDNKLDVYLDERNFVQLFEMPHYEDLISTTGTYYRPPIQFVYINYRPLYQISS